MTSFFTPGARTQSRLDRSVAQLESARAFEPMAEAAGKPVRLSVWPIVPAPGVVDPGVESISNFVDHDLSNPGSVLDFACGARTYDTSGYDHAGTDISIWPFAWTRMAAGEVRVVAAAPGVILDKQDGNADRNCDLNWSTPWNAVYVRHADGTVAWYGHLKAGSLTAKPVGATVKAGEFLGLVGSSGASSGPHLHFELHDANGKVLDPFAGACNAAGRWKIALQKAEELAPRINKLATHSKPPEFLGCGEVREVANFKNRFRAGVPITFAAYFRDQAPGVDTVFELVAPNKQVVDTWTLEGSEYFASAAYWHWTTTVPTDAAPGVWRFRSTYAGQVVEHRFVVVK